MASFFAGDPATAYLFSLRVEAVYDIPLKSVQSFSKNNSYEHIQEGGLNDFVHLKRKPNTEPFLLKVERYVTDNVTDPLANGAELVLPIFLSVYNNTFEGKDHMRTYMFVGCTVTGKEYGQLDADRSALATETVTIAFNELYMV